jgi:tetratricopeptide (TPR) repeat protein
VRPGKDEAPPPDPQAASAVPDRLAQAERPGVAEITRLIALMNAGRYAEAEDASRALLGRHPGIGFLAKLHGVALMLQGKDASLALRKASHLLPDDPETHFHLGNASQRRGELAVAIAGFRRALDLRPDYPEALFNLGNALLHVGRMDEAAASYRRALELEPRLAEAHNNLGNALRDLGELEAATASYRRALEIRPEFADAHNNLGNALRDLGDLEAATASYRRALEIRPEFADAHNNLGNALRDLGDLEAATASYRRALEIRPEFAAAHNNLGNALRDLGDLDGAIASYHRTLALQPGLAEAHNNLGNVLLDLLRLDDAADRYRRALALRPDYAHALTALGRVLRQQGRPAEAEESCRRALEIEPDSAETMTFLGELSADRGRFADADELFRRAIAIDPDLPAAWAGLARTRRMGEGDAAWLAQAQRLVSKGLPVRKEINLRYAMGKYCNDSKDYEQAFSHYRRANELTRRYGFRHDRQKLTRSVDRLTKRYDDKWLRRAQSEGIPSERPVFIVGMPRSGTTLAEQILASHPAAFGAGELPFWNEAAAACDTSVPEGTPRTGSIAGLADAYLRQLATLSADALRVVDKMPTNYTSLGLIHAALPNARIIHMRRNPVDTCLSIYFQNFSLAHSYATDLDDLAHYYTQYLRLMRHWRSTLPEGTILEVLYEELVSDSEAWSRKMLHFIGLPWDPRCLDFHETSRTVTTPSRWQVRQKISRSSVGRWRNYESLIGPLRHLLQLQ